MPPKRATLADVAALAGLSPTTVSLVLNDVPGTRLSPDAVKRVREAAHKLSYRPNPAARSLRAGKTRTIGFISDEVTVTRFASAMIRGVLDSAEQANHTVLIAETGNDLRSERTALNTMLDRRTDGVIFGLMGAKEIDVPETPADVRVVILNGSSTTGESTILPDEYAAGRAIASLLIQNGHRKIALLGAYREAIENPRVSTTVGRRFAGLDDALSEAGIDLVKRVTIELWEPPEGYAATMQLLDEPQLPTAIICLNDRLAFGAYQAIQERGLRIPEDISVVSFDDEEIAAYLRPGLTTAKIPYEEMGRQAVDLLLSSSNDELHRLVAMPIIERQSVRRLLDS
ncbi:MAG TPA: LacI family DNA-binding transcriptional regulator [Glaciibacter sp.]|nr:LacI family DNA-binding transcriptional regulator [Glaciibacter sp.]